MSDIEVYLDIMELIHAATGGEGVTIYYRIRCDRSEGSGLSVNAQIPHPLIAAYGTTDNWRKLLRTLTYRTNPLLFLQMNNILGAQNLWCLL